VIGNLRPDAYPANIVAKMRTFVAGSQLHRNLGVRSQESGLRGQDSGVRTQESGVSKGGGTLTPDSCFLTPCFEQKAKHWQVNDAGWAYGAALVDLDNDGWLDLHATAGYISKSRSEPDG